MQLEIGVASIKALLGTPCDDGMKLAAVANQVDKL